MPDVPLRLGQRVWVRNTSAPDGRSYGEVLRLEKTGGYLEGGGITIVFDDNHTIMARPIVGRGVEWDVVTA